MYIFFQGYQCNDHIYCKKESSSVPAKQSTSSDVDVHCMANVNITFIVYPADILIKVWIINCKTVRVEPEHPCGWLHLVCCRFQKIVQLQQDVVRLEGEMKGATTMPVEKSLTVDELYQGAINLGMNKVAANFFRSQLNNCQRQNTGNYYSKPLFFFC